MLGLDRFLREENKSSKNQKFNSKQTRENQTQFSQKKTNSFSLAINDIKKKKKKVIKINKHSLVIKKSLITSLTATSSPV